MNQQRVQAYIDLIDQLMWSDDDEATLAVLQSYHQFVDMQLLEVIEQQIEQLNQQGRTRPLQRLQKIQQNVQELVVQGGDAEVFLEEVLQLVAQSQGDAQQVYSFLEKNLDKLTEKLLKILPQTAKTLFAYNSEQQSVVTVFIVFGSLIQQFPQEPRWLNLELGIAAYQAALTVMTQTTMRVEWANTMINLAAAYYDRIQGDKAENIEQAIAVCRQALTVITQISMPFEWAAAMNNLANAYYSRIQGDGTENIEQAIAAHQQALFVRTRNDMPFEWSKTMNNLAIAYSDRIRGDKAENIEQAIDFYRQALTVRTQNDRRFEWAETMHNLANVYRKRIREDRAENIEQAIDFYRQALTVRTQTAMPFEWAETMANLANAYFTRIKGARAENIEQAIDAYRQALTVRTQTAMPFEWAETMTNLASAYKDRIRGDKVENIEQAIDAYRQAIVVMTQDARPIAWANTMNNLALAYSEHIQGDKAENIEQAINAYGQALTVITQSSMPFEWAIIMYNLAAAYSDRIRGYRVENIEQAIVAYQSSLTFFTPESAPDYCRRTTRNLGILYSEQNRWREAVPIYQKALQAAEQLYRNADLLDSKAAELVETADLPRRAAYAFARTGQLEQAVLTLEQGRARSLSETLNRDRTNLIELQQSYPELFTQYQDITQQLRNLEAQQRERMTSEERHSITPEVFRTAAQRLRQMLIETIEQIRQEGYTDFLAQANFADIQQAVRPEVPLVYLVATPSGSLALMVTTDAIHSVWLDKLTDERLIDMLRIWLQIYGKQLTAWQKHQKEPSAENRQVHQQAEQAWFEAIDQVTHQLWQPLMAPLIDHLKQHNFQQATLIPTGYLSLLPLHAAWVDDSTKPTGRRYALDEICFTYAPNAQSINAAQEIAQRIGTDSILAIDNPLKDLRNASREVTAAVANFHQSQILKHEQATIESVLNALSQCNILHLSCHGTADLREPLNSGLSMSDGLLTLRDLLNLRLSEQGGIRLAVLSACETGLAGTSLPDEAIGLPTGLLQAGVAGVVASLWSVSDLSTMLLLVRFYDIWRKESVAPAVALRRAQQWLRDSTEAELADYFGWLPRSPEARTYAHPFHWAAFSYTGV